MKFSKPLTMITDKYLGLKESKIQLCAVLHCIKMDGNIFLTFHSCTSHNTPFGRRRKKNKISTC